MTAPVATRTRIHLDAIIRDPEITSPFGVLRPFSRRPHTGIDVVSKSGERFVRAPGNGAVVWQWNVTSKDRSAARAVIDQRGSEWPLGWYYADIFGLMATWLDDDSDLALTFCHLEPFQTADLALHAGCPIWETRRREQTAYNVWHEWYGNQRDPAPVSRGEILGVYSDVGSSIGAHVHIEARHLEIGEDDAAEWRVFDPETVIDVP